jgi:TRAP transporter 4TM/12TM fusion protein
MLKGLLEAGTKRELKGPVRSLNTFVSLMIALYVIFAVFIYPEAMLYRSVCFGLFFFGIFISYAAAGSDSLEKVPFYDFLLAAASLSVSLYFGLEIERLVMRQVFVSEVTHLDIFFGILTIFLLIEGSRRILGPWLPALSVLALLYIFYGQYIPGRFGHQGFTLKYIVDGLFLSSYGIWGSTLGIAVSQVMVFLIFGAFFLKSGAGDFLFDFAASLAGSSVGGVAKISVITSALFGMISGGPVSNVATTGALTIPAMKKRGYSSEFAATVESCASVGGVFMPPIMGSIVFIMAEVVGIPYGDVARRAFIPAALYFVAIFFIVDIHSRKYGIGGFTKSERKPLLPILKRGLGFIVPLIYLTLRLFSGSYPSRVALETIVVIIIINALEKKNLLNLRVVLDTLIKAVHRGRMVVSTMAACGILVGVVTITGITAKFSSFLMAMTSYSSMVTLMVVMGITLFLGLAMNGTSSYLITAVICAPILIRQGYEPLSVHMFILFFAAMSSITPPVAITSFTAASIAEADPMRVSMESMKMGFVAYILPFTFIYSPSILLYGSGWLTLRTFVFVFLGVAVIAAAMEQWWFGVKMPSLMQIMIFFAGGAMVIGRMPYSLAGFAVVLAALGYALFSQRILRKEFEQ